MTPTLEEMIEAQSATLEASIHAVDSAASITGSMPAWARLAVDVQFAILANLEAQREGK